jgi:hypothetical protein
MNQRLAQANWRKSSYSSANGQCVEVAASVPGMMVAIRDSKNADGAALVITPRAWTAFLAGVRDGDFSL